jgi:hypothetical protein
VERICVDAIQTLPGHASIDAPGANCLHTAKGVVARLAGAEIPAYEDNEVTIADLLQRVAKTKAFVEGFNASHIDGTEDKDIVTKRGDVETHYKGMQFLLNHAMPNIYFHVTTVYAILRHNGVELGKRDYLGKV